MRARAISRPPRRFEAFGGFGVARLELQHGAEMFEGVVLGRLDVAALVHGEARLLEHFVERGGRRGRSRRSLAAQQARAAARR